MKIQAVTLERETYKPIEVTIKLATQSDYNDFESVLTLIRNELGCGRGYGRTYEIAGKILRVIKDRYDEQIENRDVR